MDYKTVSKIGEDFFVEKKSKFIGYAKPVNDENDAIEFINSIRKKHSDAKHNVYAYVLRDGNIARYSDDGEPQGTGGVPMLEVIKRQLLFDVCVVVTRYFGGVLLGTGGLTRAYQQGCKIALASANPVLMAECNCFLIECDYNQYNILLNIFSSFSVCIDESAFEENVKINCHIKINEFNEFLKQINEKFSGKINPVLMENKFFSYKE